MTLDQQIKAMQETITAQNRVVSDLQKRIAEIEATVKDKESERNQEEQQALLLLSQQKVITKLEELDETNALLLLNSINQTEEAQPDA